MVSKTIKIKLNVSNKLLYSVLTIFIIAAITTGVYAYGTYNPSKFGHSAGELTGVCMSDGTNCLSGAGGGSNIDMYVDTTTKKLCYDDGTSSTPCTNQIVSCTKTKRIDAGSSTSNHDCKLDCMDLNEIACDGDLISTCTGGTSVKYNFGVFKPSTYGNECECSVLSTSKYTKEISSGAGTPNYRCILGTPL